MRDGVRFKIYLSQFSDTFGVVTCHECFELSITSSQFSENSLNLRIFVETACFFFQNQVAPHAPCSEIPDPFFIFSSIGMSVKVAAAIPTHIFKEFHKEERTFDAFGTEAQVLVETAHFLIIKVNVEEFTGFVGLCDTMDEA